MLTIQFHELSAILLDFVDASYAEGGFLYLRMAGEEPVVNAIWSRLSAREYREKKYESGVQVEIPGVETPEAAIAAYKEGEGSEVHHQFLATTSAHIEDVYQEKQPKGGRVNGAAGS